MQKYKDIKEVYSIFSIDDEYMLVKNKEGIKKQYIFEIFPITVLNFLDENINSILVYYFEFLKSISTNFKIIIRNFKFNEDEYIARNMLHPNKKIKESNIYKYYIDDLKRKLKTQNIYTSKMYVCFAINSDQQKNEIFDCMSKLKNIGIYSKLLNKKEIKKLLYDSINKN